MFQSEILVLELIAIDRLAPGAIVVSEVSTLAHEIRDDTVKRAPLEVEGLAGFPRPLLARAKGAEILASSRGHVSFQFHDDAPRILPADGHIEIHLRVASHNAAAGSRGKTAGIA